MLNVNNVNVMSESDLLLVVMFDRSSGVWVHVDVFLLIFTKDNCCLCPRLFEE